MAAASRRGKSDVTNCGKRSRAWIVDNPREIVFRVYKSDYQADIEISNRRVVTLKVLFHMIFFQFIEFDRS